MLFFVLDFISFSLVVCIYAEYFWWMIHLRAPIGKLYKVVIAAASVYYSNLQRVFVEEKKTHYELQITSLYIKLWKHSSSRSTDIAIRLNVGKSVGGHGMKGIFALKLWFLHDQKDSSKNSYFIIFGCKHQFFSSLDGV